jgi:hypothetical protein
MICSVGIAWMKASKHISDNGQLDGPLPQKSSALMYGFEPMWS